MTKKEFKNSFSDSYREILEEGALQERDRVGSWLAHVNTDSDAVKSGIESGKDITKTETQRFLVKQNEKNAVSETISDSAEDILVSESETKIPDQKIELENVQNFRGDTNH